MSDRDIIVGLDMGTVRIKCVLAEINDDGTLEIVGVGICPSRGLRNGVVVNSDAAARCIEQAVEKAEHEAGRTVTHLIAGISGNGVEGLNSKGVLAVSVKGREITRTDIDKVIDTGKAVKIPIDREVIHVIPREYIVDDQTGLKNPLGRHGVRLEADVHIVTASVSSLQNMNKCIARTDFSIEKMVLGSIASADSVLSDESREDGVLLIDLGGGTTDFTVFEKGAPLLTGTLPVGSSHVTNDLAIVLKTSSEAAEQIKQENGSCWEALIDEPEMVIIPGSGGRPPMQINDVQVCQIIQSRMAEIFSFIYKKVDSARLLHKIPGGIILTGGGSELEGVIELGQAIFGLPVTKGVPSIQSNMKADMQSGEYATVLGLLKYGLNARVERMGRDRRRIIGKNTDILHRIMNWFKEFI